jgi:hypothetical protein
VVQKAPFAFTSAKRKCSLSTDAPSVERLCRLMCRKPMAFRCEHLSVRGCASECEAEPQKQILVFRKGEAFPHIKRQSRPFHQFTTYSRSGAGPTCPR